MKRGLQILAPLLVASLPLPALAQDDGAAQPAALGLDPANPQTTALPGGVTPAYHQPSTEQGDWRFDFHGFMTVPVRASFNKREAPLDGQSETTWHAPPIVPDYRDSFNYTGVVPQPYVKLLFSYGNSIVTGNISIEARSTYTGSSYFDPPSNPGITDAFLNFKLPEIAKDSLFQVNVGSFSNRYGTMGEYDEGRYGQPIIARTNAVGENIFAAFQLGELALMIEQGIGGLTDKTPVGVVPDGWNNFGDWNAGASWVNHLHAGLGYKGMATLGLHYMTAWSQDDRVSSSLADGRIDVLGADLRLTLGHFGHFYLGGSYTNADRSRTVGRVIEILNAPGGKGLMDNYLGPQSAGTGKLVTIGGQYDLSVGRLLRYPTPFAGDAPDIVVSLFGMLTNVESDDVTQGVDPTTGETFSLYDGVRKMKFGAEASYSFLAWLAASARFDHVNPNSENDKFRYTAISPRVIFRSGWNAHDQVVLQYTRFLYSDLTTVRSGYPPADDVSVFPDEDMISLSASMWW
ncbi:MAG TPA: hypothetical protein VM686_28075 [Polyangiaceae bacterium]|nr:hypothetical protein [Polyangiaceae bacterium]